jgi:hypothetical protein
MPRPPPPCRNWPRPWVPPPWCAKTLPPPTSRPRWPPCAPRACRCARCGTAACCPGAHALACRPACPACSPPSARRWSVQASPPPRHCPCPRSCCRHPRCPPRVASRGRRAGRCQHPATHTAPGQRRPLVLPLRHAACNGSETAALAHLAQYLARKLPHSYKDTRNGLTGLDYSSKFSPWLATGALSPRQILPI